MGYLLGIDAGSTNYKVIACDAAGRFLASARRPANTKYHENGWAETSPELIWEGVAACIAEVAAQLPGESCDGIAVASSGEDVLLDGAAQSVYPAIRWFDTRTEAIASAWEPFGRERIYRITGINPNPVASITKMQWIKRYVPEAWERARLWIPIAGFISLKLTGTARAPWTNACRSMAFDLNRRDWSEEILAEAGIERSLLAEPIRPGEQIGALTAAAAAATGLKEGTPVFAGGVDYACGTFATGIIRPGQMLDSTGTSEQLLAILDAPEISSASMEKNFTSVAYVVNDAYYIMGMIVASGGIFEWFKNTFACESFDLLVDEAVREPIGARGCMMLPYFSGRHTMGSDPAARGAFVGLTRATTRGTFVRAILEGLCYEMHSIVQAMQELSGQSVESIYAIGGAAKSAFWMQMKADVTGIPVRSKDVPEAAALGAAMLAGLGAGVYTSPEDAAARVQFAERQYTPDAAHHAQYMELYETLNRALYPALREFNAAVTRAQGTNEGK